MKFVSLALLAFVLTASNVFAEEEKHGPGTKWPQELSGDEGTLVVYQPQPENLRGKTLTGRAAMSMELKASKEPIFGVFWFSLARARTLRDRKIAWLPRPPEL